MVKEAKDNMENHTQIDSLKRSSLMNPSGMEIMTQLKNG